MKTRTGSFWGVMLLLLAGCGSQSAPSAGPAEKETKPVPTLKWERVGRKPFDQTAFTQGLIFSAGTLWLSTGQYNASTIQQIRLSDGQVLQHLDLPDTVFGEGLALHQNKLYQLTWENQLCYLYTPDPLKPAGQFTYKGEGWGLASNQKDLVMSNGSADIVFRDPETFKVLRKITVRDHNGPVVDLNELEFVNGMLLANVWTEDRVVVLDPADGTVVAQLDFSALTEEAVGDDPGEKVLNGLAWDPVKQVLLVTGKYWPWIYEVKVEWPEPKAPATE